jgi:hypothetical protein
MQGLLGNQCFDIEGATLDKESYNNNNNNNNNK